MPATGAQESEQVMKRDAAPIRGTQSFVHTLSSCWQRPSLTALEVFWRWGFGIPAILLVGSRLNAVLAAHTNGTFNLSELGLDHALLIDPVGALTADPMGVVAKADHVVAIMSPDLLHLTEWVAPLAFIAWIVVSSFGRSAVLRRADARLLAKPGCLMALQAIRIAALLGTFAVWTLSIGRIANFTVKAPIAVGQEPELVLYCALSILSTLGLFILWAVVSWVFSIAPLLAMLRGLDACASLKAAFRLGSIKGKLVEINLVMGIVKIALIVLAMVFSASPLPFETAATQSFLLCWWLGVTLLYFVASDFFHVVRLVAYLDLWRTFEQRDTRDSV